MAPVHVEIFSPMPEGWGLCQTCETMIAQADIGVAPYERGLEEYPQDWLEDYQRLSSLIFELADSYGEEILIRLVDPRSLQGLIKSIRYGVHRYPTFIINGHKKIIGLDAEGLKDLISSEMKAIQPYPG
jgi:hypothetical protein